MNARSDHHLRYLEPHGHLAPAYGSDWFGRLAERIARFFGTPQYIIGQTVLVVLWIVAAFGVMMAFWATVVTIAFKNLPQNVPLAESSAASNADH